MESLTLELPELTESLNPSKVFKYLQTLTSSKKLLIAYSGGLDSHVLLHLVSQFHLIDNCYEVSAMHIHHGLQKEADAWVEHCQNICDDLKIPLQVNHLGLTINKGESLEEVARKARYSALKQSLQKDEILLTAHHQNDQAETLLLQLFRGAGVQGLASMPHLSDFGLGKHARPLLNETGDKLLAYAKTNQLSYIEDPSNQDCSFDRNFLRKEILPKLRKRWSGIDKTISRSASIQSETLQLLNEMAEQDLISVSSERSEQSKTLTLTKLSSLSKARQKLLVRHWITHHGFIVPSEKKLKHIFSDVINAKEDAQPLVEWLGTQIRRYQGELYIMSPLSDHDSQQVITWDIKEEPLKIYALGITIPALNLKEINENVTIRFRQGGEVVKDAKRGNISLKNLLNEAGIPPWLRSRVPLVYVGGTLIKIIK